MIKPYILGKSTFNRNLKTERKYIYVLRKVNLKNVILKLHLLLNLQIKKNKESFS